MDKIKVALADDHQLVRHGIKLMVQSFESFEVVCDGSNGKELIENIDKLECLPDIALVDISMPIMDGFETIQYIVKHYQSIKCIALSVSTDYNTVFKVIDSGAKGYLPKDTTPEIMEKTMIEVITAGVSYGSFVVDKLLEYQKNREGESEFLKNLPSHAELSIREIEFIKYSCSELTYKEVAGLMHLSPRTVDGYRESVFKKCKLSSRIGILLFAMKAGLFTPNV
jgi:DNA-binding NarL/FixJ family response regulator